VAVAKSHNLIPRNKSKSLRELSRKNLKCVRTSHGSLSDEKTHANSGSVTGSGMSLVSGRQGNSDTPSHTVPGTCDDQKRPLG